MLISQDHCLKCPWVSFLSDFILSHFQLPFFPLSPCQVVRMTLISKTCFSFPDSDRAPTCHWETIPQKPINSFKSKISPCALSTGARRVPSSKDRCNSKEKCKCAHIISGSLKPKAVYLHSTQRSQFPRLYSEKTSGNQLLYQTKNIQQIEIYELFKTVAAHLSCGPITSS